MSPSSSGVARSSGHVPTAFRVHGWRQFADVHVTLDPHLTVLVGPNGTGKSTLLSVLAVLLAGERPEDDDSRAAMKSGQAPLTRPIGHVELSDGSRISIQCLSTEEAEQLSFADGSKGVLAGSFHHATKLLFGRRLGGGLQFLGDLLIPVGGSSSDRAYVIAKHIVTFASSATNRPTSLFSNLRRQWDNWTMFSAQSGSLLRQAPDRLVKRILESGKTPDAVFERFSSLFVEIAGESCGIRKVRVEDDRLVAVTATGGFSFDAVSHGLALIAMLLWDCVLLDAIAGSGLMLIDEPENHLHPGLQRSLMATLVREFPGIQFVVATHSPFFVGAARESRVCLLAFGENGRVEARMLSDTDLDRGGTANDILREALGTTTSRPLWLEDELKGRVSKYLSREPDKEVVATLHKELKQEGQADLLPDAVRVLKKMHDEQRMP
jgi:predicted ATPase